MSKEIENDNEAETQSLGEGDIMSRKSGQRVYVEGIGNGKIMLGYSIPDSANPRKKVYLVSFKDKRKKPKWVLSKLIKTGHRSKLKKVT